VTRAIADVSQKELAEKIKVDPSLISLIESGRRKPSLTTAENIAQALNVPLHIFTLLAAEPEDLAGTQPEVVGDLGMALARLLFNSDSSRGPHESRGTRRRATHTHAK
jgi:transcriptional regulator with XRE-family HTH domain